jgi:AcrR family transcriptional regulator
MTRDTRTRLVDAAALEFNERGFAGTDTNRIARRAGFAPQTFYRSFANKTEIFIAAYRAWEDTERTLLNDLLARRAASKQLVEAVAAHHRAHRIFRRSLRQLSLDDPDVRRARSDSRRRQLEQIRAWQQRPDADLESLAVTLLTMERLADALAEDEFEDLGLRPRAVENALAEIIDALRNP